MTLVIYLKECWKLSFIEKVMDVTDNYGFKESDLFEEIMFGI